MIGHFIAVPFELGFRSSCNYFFTSKDAAPWVCNLFAPIVHEVVEHIVDQTAFTIGISVLQDDSYPQTHIPLITGITSGITINYLFSFDHLIYDAAIGMIGNIIGNYVGQYIEEIYQAYPVTDAEHNIANRYLDNQLIGNDNDESISN